MHGDELRLLKGQGITPNLYYSLILTEIMHFRSASTLQTFYYCRFPDMAEMMTILDKVSESEGKHW